MVSDQSTAFTAAGQLLEIANLLGSYFVSGKEDPTQTIGGQKFSDLKNKSLTSLLQAEQAGNVYSSGEYASTQTEANRRAKQAKKGDIESLIKAIQSREADIRARKAAPALAQSSGSML